jgi:adenylate cyclase
MLPDMGRARTRGRHKTASIRRALLQVLVLGIVLPAALVWGVGHLTAQAAVTVLWDGLSRRIADYAVERTLRYLETGETALAYNDELVAQGRIDLADHEGLLDYLYAGLEANPNVTWYSFASPDGAYISAYRTATGIRLTWRVQVEGGARYRDFRVAPDRTRTALPEEVKPYDPRTRAWYENAVATRRAVWSRPFLFASGPPGFILSRALRDGHGAVQGVWGIEYEMSYVSRFLQELVVGETGRTYLITASGEVIGHPLAGTRIGEPDGWIVVERDGKRAVATARDHRDPWLRTAYCDCVKLGRGEHHLSFTHEGDKYLAASKPFPDEAALPWGILVVVPEDEILGTINRNNLYAAVLAALIAGAVLALAFFYVQKRLTSPLADIAHDLDRMARLDTDVAPRVKRSALREVDGMVVARERMRGGLRSFMKYVPAQLVRDLVTAGAEARLGGEKKELTILFSDVVDFTTVSEELNDPEALVTALGTYLKAMSSTIASQGGTVDKYIGDAVMAFWGAPRPMRDHTVRACRAAWMCQRALDVLRREWERDGHPLFKTKIGVHVGEAVVGNIGWAERMNYTVMGDAVNVASRMEGVCGLYDLEIAISEDTWRVVGDEFLARPVDFVSVKGREAPLVVYELLGPHAEAPQEVRAFAEHATRAFDLYRRRAFAEARAAFDRALAVRPADVGCRGLRERCERYEAEPPPDDWTGAVRLERKR